MPENNQSERLITEVANIKRMILGVTMFICGSLGVLLICLSGLRLVIERGIINGSEQLFHHLEFFGVMPIFNTFMIMAIIGLLLCIVECFVFASNVAQR